MRKLTENDLGKNNTIIQASNAKQTKLACVTLDLEPDYGQDHIDCRYLVDKTLLSQEYPLRDLFDGEIKLTTFITTRLLEETPEIRDSLEEVGSEVELHSHSHLMDRPLRIDVERGIEVFEEVMGEKPLGYRAPQGRITSVELEALSEHGVKFDSSVLPFFRPLKYWNLSLPQTPYRMRDYPIIELPIATVPQVRLPISFSYMMLVGPELYEWLFRTYGLPEVLVVNFHLHDLFPSKDFAKLSPLWRMIYNRIYNQDPVKHLIRFIQMLVDENYSLIYMEELYRMVAKRGTY